ncbi:hypothetical protein [Vibrio alfacsensis]|uniref:hypothetical protein n=1 Tax=Vibrio alfacsensis TaxID=1074311 RepID=UPI001BEF314E|nr:hypothetical protein [Vibrio alfacsensis]BCN25714.1 hypothetical protein VYA_29060 [Vibrio alfacsensis]
MRKTILTLGLVTALFGCEDATKAIDEAQAAANKAIDSVQEQIESVESAFNVDQFQGAADAAQELAESVEEAMNVDFSDPEALVEAKEHIANAYACLVDASTESTVEKVMDKVMASIGDEETKSLIEEGIEKAQAAKECVM